MNADTSKRAYSSRETRKALDVEVLEIIKSSKRIGITCKGVLDALHENKARIHQVRRAINRLIADGFAIWVGNNKFGELYRSEDGKRYIANPEK